MKQRNNNSNSRRELLKTLLINTKNSLMRVCLSFKKSFTLIELSVALAVMGVLAGGGLAAYNASNPKLRSDLNKIQKIEEALQQFFNTNGRLPFPAYGMGYPESNDYLSEYKQDVIMSSREKYKCVGDSSLAEGGGTYSNCVASDGDINCCPGNFVIWGVVPTRTLGLPDDYAYDSNGHNFEYVVNSVLAIENGKIFRYNSDNYYEKKSYNPTNNGGYGVYFEDKLNTNAKKDKNIDIDMLSIRSNQTNQVVSSTKNNTAYAIISKGKTNKCYFNTRVSNGANTTVPSDNTRYNCAYNYSKYNFTSLTLRQGYSKDFDNIVVYMTLSDLVYQMSHTTESVNELTQGDVISYQPRISKDLQTNSKDLVGAVNELQEKVKELELKLAAAQSSSKMYLLGTSNNRWYYNNNIYSENGTLYLTKTQDLSGTVDSKPALIVGGSNTQAHIEVDPNEIHAKSNGTTPSALYLNCEGGSVNLGCNGNTEVYVKGQTIKRFICEQMYPTGSVYISTNGTPPNSRLGCGGWSLVGANRYLVAVDGNGYCYNAYGNNTAYCAGQNLEQCLPNISGNIGDRIMTYGEADRNKWGVFNWSSWNGRHNFDDVSNNGGFGMYSSLNFNAAASNGTYRDNCSHVRPYSYGVFIWVRTS